MNLLFSIYRLFEKKKTVDLAIGLQSFNKKINKTCFTYRPMSQTSQTAKKNQSQLPAINNKDQKVLIHHDISQSADEANVLPLTHANKRKKHRKKYRKHSPQYYEHKRLQRYNKRLEQKWDNHFINDQIPQIYVKKKNHKPGKTLSKLTSDKRSITPLNAKAIGHTTGHFIVKKDNHPLPKIQKPSKRSNSFNVHVVPQKPTIATQKFQKQSQTANQIKAQLKPPTNQNQKRKRISQQSRRPVQLQKQKPNYLEEYRKTLNQLHEQIKFTNCHKQALELFFQMIDKKIVRDLFDRQFNLIKKKESLVFKVNMAILNRQKLLQKVKQMGVKLINDDKETIEVIDHYRTSTLAVVEEILKWKETWHALYYEVFKKSRNFDFVYQTQNYLLTLASSTDDILQKISKEKQTKAKTENKNGKTQITEQISPKKQQKAQQKLYQKLNKSQQTIQKLQTQNNPKPLDQNTSNTQKKLKEQQIILSTNVQQAEKDNRQQSPIKQLQQKTGSVQKPPKKPQAQKQTQIATQNDPFLISLHSIAKQDKNIILKIRACELLLVEETFNFLKR